MADIELPALGESVTEGTITRWFKEIGDTVAEDEPLFEVSTDKVDSEVPSPVAGTLTKILVEEGDTVDVGTQIAVVSAGDEAPATSSPTADASPAASPEPAAPGPEPLPGSAEPERPEILPTNEAATPAAHEPLPEPLPGSEPALPAPDVVPASGGSSPLLSPVVRRLLDEAGVASREVIGTGLGGRITRADAESHLRKLDPGTAGTAAPPAAAQAPAPTAAQPPAVSAPGAPPAPRPSAPDRSWASTAPRHAGVETTVALNKIRTITADHMLNSLETSAHAYVSTEVDFERVDRVRSAHKVGFKAEEGVSLTFLPFVARAMVDALETYPHVNASMGENHELVVHGSVNLGIAVDLNHDGLIVPVVHEAQDRRLRALARDIADLAGRAKSRSLGADDITGGTVTITNVGATGNAFLLPIINQPQVMILSTDGISRRPVVVTDSTGAESIAIHSVGNLTLGWDHRAFDGAYAAQFLAEVKEILETRDWTSEL